MPAALTAAVSTAVNCSSFLIDISTHLRLFKIHSALDDYSTGICIKTDFNADVYEDVYLGHMKALSNIRRTNPDGYHRLMADLYNMSLSVFH